MGVKSRLIQWFKNSTLCTEHLDECVDSLQTWVTNLQYHCNKDDYGIINLEIDPIKIIKGIYEIKELSVIMHDFSYINYKRDQMLQSFIDGTKSTNIYPLSLDVNDLFQDSKTTEVVIYLCKKEQNILESTEMVNEVGGKVIINHKTPQLSLETTVSDNMVNIPIGVIKFQNGSFYLSEYVPPCLILKSKELYKKIEDLFLIINHKTLTMRDKIFSTDTTESKSYFILQALLQVLEKLDYILTHQLHPKVVYKHIRECVYLLLWFNFSNTPKIASYKHTNIYEIINNSLSILLSLADAGQGAKRIDLVEKEKGNFFAEIDTIKQDYITMLFTPINESIISKIKICSKDFLEDVLKKRIIGAQRKLMKVVANTMVLKIEKDEFIKERDVICVLGAFDCSQVSILIE